MTDAVIPVKYAALALEELLQNNLVDRSLRITRNQKNVFVPLLSTNLSKEIIGKYEIRIEGSEHRHRVQREDPFDIIENRLRKKGLSETQLAILPDKWELLGHVLILKLNENLLGIKEEIAEVYATVLGAETVLRDCGRISGDERLPKTELLHGKITETTHLENGIKYSLDAAQIMFSSGNIHERIRMATFECRGKTVLDMFAGIGYFALPIAIYGKPEKIYACEIRKLSYDYLMKNANLNNVNEILVPYLGDNRNFILPEPADLIVMGYLKSTHEFLPKALSCLRNNGCIIYHENCPNELLPERPVRHLESAAGEKWKFRILSKQIVKSFSPGVSHVVIDAQFSEI